MFLCWSVPGDKILRNCQRRFPSIQEKFEEHDEATNHDGSGCPLFGFHGIVWHKSASSSLNIMI